MRFNRPRIEKKGSHLADPYYGFIYGTDALRNTFRNGMLFYREIEDVCLAMFPPSFRDDSLLILSDANPDEKAINISNLITTEIHNDIFDHGIAQFFRHAVHELLITGENFQSIYWDDKKEFNKDYIMPVDFSYLRTETVREKKKHGRTIGYVQEYSKHAKKEYKGFRSSSMLGTSDEGDEEWKFEFTPDEILHFKYPFGNTTPVQESLPVARKDRLYSDGLLRLQLSIPSRKKSFKMERLRFKSFNQSQDDHNTKRSKISKRFFYIIGMDSSPMTLYYAAYRVSESYKKMNAFRNYLIDAFNTQVMQRIAEKNGLSQNLSLKPNPVFFSTDEEIDHLFEDFKSGKLELLDMYKKIRKRNN